MNSHARGVIATIAVLTACSGALGACGDKFLVTSRGTRFERAGFVRPRAQILLLALPSTTVADSVQGLSVDRALSKVGYVPTVVTVREGVSQALATRWDVVVMDLADRDAVLAGLGQHDSGGAVRPALVALAGEVPGEAVRQGRRDLDDVVRRPKRSGTIVDAVDQVLYDRLLAAKRRAKDSR